MSKRKEQGRLVVDEVKGNVSMGKLYDKLLGYRVTRAVNTTEFALNRLLSKKEVDDLIAAGFHITIDKAVYGESAS